MRQNGGLYRFLGALFLVSFAASAFLGTMLGVGYVLDQSPGAMTPSGSLTWRP